MSEQNSTVYSVRMKTSVGIRLGLMTVCREKDIITGFFNILNHNEPFTGIIDENGNCELSGKIVTLMRTINYVAAGTITCNNIDLSIQDGRHTLKITGTPCQQEKE
ncbi:MAG: hypothetical protein ACI39R_04575 [Lachnospiraceae bacterium]